MIDPEEVEGTLRELAELTGSMDHAALLRELGDPHAAERAAELADARLDAVAERMEAVAKVAADARAQLPRPAPDYSATLAFLRWFAPGGPWLVVSIDPEKKAVTRAQSFTVAEEAKLRAWLTREGRAHNLYFTVNPTRYDAPKQKKPALTDMAALAWLHADLDPDKSKPHHAERERILGVLHNLPASIPPPSCIVDSGGGFQAFWRLATPLELAGDDESTRESSARHAAAWNRALEQALGGDRTHNLDRLMRLPGTVNWPGPEKRAAGRRPALAQVLEMNDSRHPLQGFQRVEDPKTTGRVTREATPRAKPAAGKVSAIHSLDSVPQVRACPALRELLEKGGTHADRSLNAMHAAGWLTRLGVADAVQEAILLDPRLGISAHILAQADPARAARRAVEQAQRDEQEKQAREAAAQAAGEFLLGDNGRPKKSQANLRVALQKLGVALWYDELAERHMVDGLQGHGPQLDDAAMRAMAWTLEEEHGLVWGWDTLVRYLLTLAEQRKRHPVREYLAGLKWDGIPRLDRWLTTYLGVEDSTYAREVGLRVLLAGVARARTPGCKFDEMMILEGAQGAKKSSALAVLAGKAEWFTDTVPLGADERRFMESVAGKWIVEASELRGMKRGEVEALKATLSRQVDRARLAYARLPVDRPRQCILIGTTNAEEYLRDGSGNRRFWPVRVGEVKLDELVRDRDQLWAEAAHRQARGEAIHMDPAIWAAAQVEQASRQARDPFADALEAALGEVEDGRLTVRDAWLIVGMDPGKATQEDNVRLGEAMRALGWRRDKLRFSDGSPRRCYAVGSGSQRVSVEGGGQGVVVLVDGRRRLD
jgi:hypothetical protein